MMATCKRALLVATLIAVTATAVKADDVTELSWGQLIPPEAMAENLKSRSFLGGARPPGQQSEAQMRSQVPEDDWMSSLMKQPGQSKAPAVVQELDGKRVRLGGYVVALDFDITKVKQFLLVPFVGACIHVPPPPPNQIIYVEAKEPFEVTGQFDPVYITGVLRTQRQTTGLAETGYSMKADTVSLRNK